MAEQKSIDRIPIEVCFPVFSASHTHLDAPLTVAIEMEGHCYSRLRSSKDFKEGVEAFHSKRTAVFIGE